ncbi:uncharacterized protein [Procambarus clarkii]|uniref:uncharacterized protein n=1 Tax=Procambarus clarkii TaxID=6728 RepID=UPI0037441E13
MEPLDLPGRGRTASQEVLQDAAVVSSPGLGRPHDADATHDPHHTTTVSSSSPRPVSPMATGTPKRKKGKAEACTRGTKRVSSRAQPARKRFMPSKYDSSLPVNSDGSPLASTEPSPRPPSACLSSGGHSPSRIQLEQVKHTLHDVQSTTGSSYAKQRSPSLRPSRPPNSSSTAMSKRRNYRFTDDLQKEFKFIKLDNLWGDGTRVVCQLCKIYFSVARRGRNDIQLHLHSQKHQDVVKTLASMSKRRNYRFTDDLQKEFKFIKLDNLWGDGTRVVCQLCKIYFSVARRGRNDIQLHLHSQKHQDVVKTLASMSKRRNYRFTDDLQKEFKFIKLDNLWGDGTRVVCQLCKIYFSVARRGRNDIQLHLHSQKHQDVVKTLASNNPFVCSTIEIPTVVGLLRNILTQYPDNGQIIKELVQNAEDAGATEVEVVHDTRRVQCPGAHAHLHTFLTGPALCLYNNATFTDDDWRGIQKFSDSIKQDDPLKVGQFGLGFKSVFHITGTLRQ